MSFSFEVLLSEDLSGAGAWRTEGQGRQPASPGARRTWLQVEYAAWADALPGGLRDTATAEALQAIVELDLEPLADIVPPRGYGRD
jgi:hypothetical protein